MRYSSDTDRTQVYLDLASGKASEEILDTLSEEKTNMTRPDDASYFSRPAARDERRENINQDNTATNNTERDLEHGAEGEDFVEVEEQSKPKQDEEKKDPNLIEWEGVDDPENPMNWAPRKKWIVTITLGLMTFCVTFASSVFSNATVPTAEEFGVSTEVMTLGTSLFVLGFGVGPLIWGPGSELFGRKNPLFLGYALFAIFQIPVAVAQNVETIMLCRFFGGVFASAPLAIVGGALADFFGPVDRGVAVCVFAAATFIGPIAGPIMGYVISDVFQFEFH